MGCKPERRSSNFCQFKGNNCSSGEAVGCVRLGMGAPEQSAATEEISCSPVFGWIRHWRASALGKGCHRQIQVREMWLKLTHTDLQETEHVKLRFGFFLKLRVELINNIGVKMHSALCRAIAVVLTHFDEETRTIPHQHGPYLID